MVRLINILGIDNHRTAHGYFLSELSMLMKMQSFI